MWYIDLKEQKIMYRRQNINRGRAHRTFCKGRGVDKDGAWGWLSPGVPIAPIAMVKIPVVRRSEALATWVHFCHSSSLRAETLGIFYPELCTFSSA